MAENPAQHELEATDREIDFYRRRAGQVFFLSLTAEILILAGRERIVVPRAWPWIQPLSYGVLFLAVAAFGILLGREYRSRIHVLKSQRKKRADFDAPSGGLTLSEIEMLYVVLVFLSSSGLVLVWLNALTSEDGRSWVASSRSTTFWALLISFVSLGAGGIVWVSWKTLLWLLKALKSNPTQALQPQTTPHVDAERSPVNTVSGRPQIPEDIASQ